MHQLHFMHPRQTRRTSTTNYKTVGKESREPDGKNKIKIEEIQHCASYP